MQDTPVRIDGRQGEGGGQVLRTSLALAIGLGREVRITNIRANRKKAGLLRQHLACVNLARDISAGSLQGAELGSTELAFRPGKLNPGSYRVAVGSAGSSLLVLQSVLPCLLRANGDFELWIEGGTHNPMAPPFGFFEESFLPLVRKMGANLEVTLDRPGFYPAGGGQITARIGRSTPIPFALLERGEPGRHSAHLGLANLAHNILEREWETIAKAMNWTRDRLVQENMSASRGPGNVLDLRLRFEHLTQVYTAFGAPGVSGHRLASKLCQQAKRALGGNAPVPNHLADQLMLPLAFLGGGSFRATSLDSHATTNAGVIEQFAPGTVRIHEGDQKGVLVEVQPLPEP